MKINIPSEPEPAEHDYKTFWQDFAIADRFGVAAVKDTYLRSCSSWQENPEYFGALCLTLNHRLWKHYNDGHMGAARVYDVLWKDAMKRAHKTYNKSDDASRRFWALVD